MNEIESADLAINLPSENNAELLALTSEETEYSNEIEGMFLEIKALKNRLQQINELHRVPQKIILRLETAEQSLANILEYKENSQNYAEYYAPIRDDILDLKISAGNVIKACAPFGYILLSNTEDKRFLAEVEEKKKIFDEKNKYYFPVKNVSELNKIKAECANNKELYVAILCKILPINEDSFNLQNEEALQRLELEKECWNELDLYFKYLASKDSDNDLGRNWDVKRYVTVMISMLYGEEQSKLINFKQRVDYLYSVTKLLLDHYGENIKLSLRVTVEGKIIDLFVRLDRKRAFALMIRSYEDTSVSWHSEKKDFYVTSKRGKGTDKWNSLSQAIVQLKSVFALKKEKHPVLGVSKAERTAPIIRAIVLAEGTKIDKNRNSPDLWVEFGKAPVLKIATDTLTYIVEQQHLLDFLTFPDPE